MTPLRLLSGVCVGNTGYVGKIDFYFASLTSGWWPPDTSLSLRSVELFRVPAKIALVPVMSAWLLANWFIRFKWATVNGCIYAWEVRETQYDLVISMLGSMLIPPARVRNRLHTTQARNMRCVNSLFCRDVAGDMIKSREGNLRHIDYQQTV